jgi:hypothetical protein
MQGSKSMDPDQLKTKQRKEEKECIEKWMVRSSDKRERERTCILLLI